MYKHNKIFLCTECPAGFTYVESVNGCYKALEEKERADAELACGLLNKDAHLLVVDNAEEQSAVAKILRQFTFSG